MYKKRLIVQLAFTGVITLSVLSLTGCDKSTPHLVACAGVSNNNEPINMPLGTCKKLAGNKPISLTCDVWHDTSTAYICEDTGSKLTVPRYTQSDYVRCYGIAAATMNDCGTATTACGGAVHVDRQKDAWIAIPNGICKQIKGSTSQLNVETKKN